MHTPFSASDRIQLSAEQAHAEMRAILGRIGYDGKEQTVLANHLLDAALCGYEYSGMPKILDLAGHAKALAPRTAPRVVHETPVSALIDGGNTVGMLAVDAATDLVIERAQTHGFGVVGVFNSWMTGRSAYFVERIAQAGLIGMHTASTFAIVAPPGAAKAAIGTNPIAFAFPTEADPLVIDLGTSAFMMSEMALLERRGGQLPEGVAIDAQGQPTRDPGRCRGAFCGLSWICDRSRGPGLGRDGRRGPESEQGLWLPADRHAARSARTAGCLSARTERDAGAHPLDPDCGGCGQRAPAVRARVQRAQTAPAGGHRDRSPHLGTAAGIGALTA